MKLQQTYKFVEKKSSPVADTLSQIVHLMEGHADYKVAEYRMFPNTEHVFNFYQYFLLYST